LQARYDFAGRKYADIELAAGQRGNALGKRFGGAEDGIERLGEAGGQAPIDSRRALRERRSSDGCGGCAYCGLFQKLTTFHIFCLLMDD
jgi:hypothetical protein